MRPFIIPVFIPHGGCPHRCVFCDQTGITGSKQTIPSPGQIIELAKRFLEYRGKRRGTVQIAFYGGNFLGLPQKTISGLLGAARQLADMGLVGGVRFSTRPDTINDERLNLIRDFPVSTVEIGVQSMIDRILAVSNRGHTAEDTKRAVLRLKERDYETGIQLMVGLPGDNEAGALESAEKVAALLPDFVRIYPTVVIKNSPLEKWWREGKFVPMSLDQSVTLVKRLYLLFNERRIPVIRMGLQASEDLNEGKSLVAGPHHPAFGHLVHSEIFLDKAMLIIQSAKPESDKICLKVHPSSESKLRGLKNGNIRILKERYGLDSIKIVADPGLNEDELVVGDG